MIPRRLLLLVDVSGSMSTQSRAMLHLAYGLVAGTLRTEVFCFGTRLTRTTDLLAGRDPDLAVERASAGVVDWAGGTRIGDSLGSLLRDPVALRHVRGSVVLGDWCEMGVWGGLCGGCGLVGIGSVNRPGFAGE
ncbi:MAG: VWA domain-containing protein, partial [bacterium]|nr:VWA domain-containing protein [bacterium]